MVPCRVEVLKKMWSNDDLDDNDDFIIGLHKVMRSCLQLDIVQGQMSVKCLGLFVQKAIWKHPQGAVTVPSYSRTFKPNGNGKIFGNAL